MISFLLGLLPAIFTIVALVLFIRRRQPLLRSFGLSVSRSSPADAIVGLIIPALGFTFIFFAEWALQAIVVTPGTITLSTFLTDVLAQLLLAAILEELIYRVGLLSGVVAMLDHLTYGRWIAVAFTAALFGAAHLSNPGATWIAAVGTGLGGAIYAVAFISTRSFVLPLALHLSWNMSEGLFGFPISGMHVPGILTIDQVGADLVTGGAYGPEAGIPGLIARFIVFALVVLYLKYRWRNGSLTRLRFAPDPQPKTHRQEQP